MPVERNIGLTPVEMKSLERELVPSHDTLADTKEFSLDTVEAVGSEGPYSIACAKCAKCVGPCVQQCLPQPPPPKCR